MWADYPLNLLRDIPVRQILSDGHLPNRRLCLRPGEHHLSAGVADVLLADGDCLVLCVQVTPEERHQLAFPQSTNQLQVEHGEDYRLDMRIIQRIQSIIQQRS